MKPEVNSLDFPHYHSRRKRLTLITEVSTECAYSLISVTRWDIYTCNRTNCTESFPLSRSISKDSLQLDIPSHTLPEGKYKFTFNIYMFYFPNMTATNGTYVEIGNSRVAVNLVKFGTSFISIGSSQDLIFDPGEYSVRFDKMKFVPEVSFSYLIMDSS